MAKIDEIAPDVYRISVLYPEINLLFNHFVVKDDEPLLFHTGLRRMFPEIREAVSKILDLRELRWISFSHFESDECGSLNEWLSIAPKATPAVGIVGGLVNISDFSSREPRILPAIDALQTGKYRFRYIPTPHVPHGWDAGVLWEENAKTLFCSDLCHQDGEVEAITSSDILGRIRETLTNYQAGPLANYVPYNQRTGQILNSLADLKPKTLATMHGSAYAGNCEQTLRDLAVLMREVLGEEESTQARAS